LVHQIAAPTALMSVGLTLADSLLKNSPQALLAAKQLIRFVTGEKITPQLAEKTAVHLANLRATPEAQEGLWAFLKKRAPKWQEK
jgi:methylglutaconyl-CoA hydratase